MPKGVKGFQPGNTFGSTRAKPSKDFKQMLVKAAPDCLNALMDIVKNGKTDKVRVQAACAVLDRCYGRPGQQIRIDHTKPIDTGAIMAALADQARGIVVDQDEDGVQRLLITPSQQLPDTIPVSATELTNIDDTPGNVNTSA